MASFPFSNRTIVRLAEAIAQGNTHTTMDALFFECDVAAWEDPQAPNKDARSLSLLKAMKTDGSDEAASKAREITILILAKGKPAGAFGKPSPWFPPLLGALNADGWDFAAESGSLTPVAPGVSVADEVDWIEAALLERGWSVAAGHYGQALDNFGQGNWAAANSQLRTFFETFIRTAGGTIDVPGSGQVQAAADALQQKDGLLLKGEAEFLKKLWGILHRDGSHPGLGDEDESRFRLLTLTSYSRLLLSRLPDPDGRG